MSLGGDNTNSSGKIINNNNSDNAITTSRDDDESGDHSYLIHDRNEKNTHDQTNFNSGLLVDSNSKSTTSGLATNTNTNTNTNTHIDNDTDTDTDTDTDSLLASWKRGCFQFVLLFQEGNLKSFYMLALMFLSFAASNLCMYIVTIVSKEIEQDLDFGDGEGAGQEYYYLAGPVFVVIFTIAGIPVGYFADRQKRTSLLSLSLFFWSIMTLVSGFCTAYWQLLLARIGLAIGEAGCIPYAASLISDHFVVSRSAALSILNWGLYFGYSSAFAVGNFLVGPLGWRWTFYISSFPGIILSFLIYFTVKEPERGLVDKAIANQEKSSIERTKQSTKDSDKMTTAVSPTSTSSLHLESDKIYSLKESFILFFTARSALLLCLAGAIRNAGGYVWSLNTNTFYKTYRSLLPEEISAYMSWTPLVSGSLGTAIGGLVADSLANKYGSSSRLLLLVVSQLLAAPLAAGALWLDYPWCFIIQLPANLFSEMWIGVTMAIVVDIFPLRMRSFAIALYFFIIQNIGGNATLLVDPLQYDAGLGFQNALLILFPGAYVLSSLFFGLAYLSMRMESKNGKTRENTEEETPLLA